MREIKSSKAGVEYASACRLKTKQRVFTEAVLMKIPHNHPGVSDISLKLGRYRFPSKHLVEIAPKSELTLDNDELNMLIGYIAQCYSPITLGVGKYIDVSEENEELIIKFKNLLENDDNTARLLMSNGILSRNVLSIANSIAKQDALKQFKEKLGEDLLERYWQNWFSANKWVLGSDFACIVDERSIDTEHIADYIMRSFDGFIDLVEIKRPNKMPFWASSKDHDNYIPSTELIQAITQCLNYLHAIEQESNSVKFFERTKSKVIKPRCTLIYGRSIDWNEDQREAYRILNSAYGQMSILTYDHLLCRAENILSPMNDYP